MSKLSKSVTLHIFSTLSVAISLGFLGCEISSGNETVRQVSVQVAGVYRNSGGIASNQSGDQITSLNLLQSGERLDGIDNNGNQWTGTIGRADNSVATVTITGRTSNGVQVVITGEIRVEGTTAFLSGIWVEPSLRSTVSAEASVTPSPEPTPTGTPGATVTPTPEVVLTT